MVSQYVGINIFDVDELPIDAYLFYLREAFIHKMNQTEEGRKYLENCWRVRQTEPDKGSLREKFGERK